MGTEDQSAAAGDVWTVRRILEWTTGFLRDKGVESPRLESELLLAHARQCQRIRLYTDFDVALTDTERTRMREFVHRRSRREPLAYIVGSKEFFGRRFEVGQGILIPRPETEKLIDICLERVPKNAAARILEIGCGSGCVAITLACQLPACQITAIDLSPVAVEVSTRNAALLKVADRVQIVRGDCLQPVLKDIANSNIAARFDVLVSNPPYVREDEFAGLQPEVGQHEPREALVSGVDGLDMVRRIAQDARHVLQPGGLILLELDPVQCSSVVDLLSANGFEQCIIHRDLSGHQRVVEGRLQEQ